MVCAPGLELDRLVARTWSAALSAAAATLRSRRAGGTEYLDRVWFFLLLFLYSLPKVTAAGQHRGGRLACLVSEDWMMWVCGVDFFFPPWLREALVGDHWGCVGESRGSEATPRSLENRVGWLGPEWIRNGGIGWKRFISSHWESDWKWNGMISSHHLIEADAGRLAYKIRGHGILLSSSRSTSSL